MKLSAVKCTTQTVGPVYSKTALRMPAIHMCTIKRNELHTHMHMHTHARTHKRIHTRTHMRAHTPAAPTHEGQVSWSVPEEPLQVS